MRIFKGYYRLKLSNGNGGFAVSFVSYLYNGYTITIHPTKENEVDMIEIELGERVPFDPDLGAEEINIVLEEHPYIDEILDSIVKSHLLLKV